MAVERPAVPLRLVAPAQHDDGLSMFSSVRPRLFAIAYRMLGSAAEAEDVVQDVWLRWQSADRRSIENAPAFLATTTTRLCLNVANSAYGRRVIHSVNLNSEPVDTSSDPEQGAQRKEALKLALLLLLERLSPNERAAYVLREAFEYPYRQIAEMLQRSEANVRQLVSRARKRIVSSRQRKEPTAERARLRLCA